MNGLMLKARAQQIIKNSDPKVIRVAIVFLAVSFVFMLLSSYITGSNISEDDLLQIQKHIENGNMDYAIRYIEDYMPSPASQGIGLLIEIVMSIFSVGFIIFLLNTIRGTEPCYGNLLDGFGMPLRIVIMNFFMGVFIALWSMLLVVPGIIASYSYRMSTYLLIDHPEYSTLECLKESKRMMKGHKWELFCLDLSFIGWALLTAFPGVGWLVRIWTTPYFSTTYALYYEQLSGKAAFDGGYVDFDDRDAHWL